MYSLEILYEQLKLQLVESVYMNKYNSINEDACDVTEAKLDIKNKLKDIEKEARKRRNGLMNKLKYRHKIATRILKGHKESALACRPIGLNYKDYKTFIANEDCKEMLRKGTECLCKFNPDLIPNTSLTQHLLKDSDYKQLLECYCVTRSVLVPGSNVVVNTEDKELTKHDIAEAVAFLESFEEMVDRIPCGEVNDDLTIMGTSNILRENATYKKFALNELNSCMYYTTICSKLDMQFEQAAHIVIKAATYNPRNLRESAVIQEMIDSEFYMKK